MTSSAPARTRARRVRIRRIRVAGALLLVAVIAAALGDLLPASAPSPAFSSLTDAPPLGEPGRPLGIDDGAVPDGTTVLDDEIPGVARLDPALLGALREAADDAAADGVELLVDSGWRSRAYQEHLLREAVAEHGSEQEAARWVATPDTSAHVSGDAVDIGPAAAAEWLAEHGPEHGLCRTYRNEPWHFEHVPDAGAYGCPAPYADPTHDPRMRP